MRGDRFAVACVVVLALYCVLFAVLGVVSVAAEVARPMQALAFDRPARDRPVLESVQAVWNSRMTGVSVFDFDGVHYVIDNLPKEYIDYSAWYVRLP